MKLPNPVPNWRQAWRWTSVHAMGAAIAIQAGYALLPLDWRAHLTSGDLHALTIAILILGIVGSPYDHAAAKPLLPKPTVPPSNDFHQRDP